jgi:hypothetical protein
MFSITPEMDGPNPCEPVPWIAKTYTANTRTSNNAHAHLQPAGTCITSGAILYTAPNTFLSIPVFKLNVNNAGDHIMDWTKEEQ